MNVTIGSAPDSWGVWFASDPKQTPWQRFLDEVAEAGYSWIELGPYGYLPTDLNVLGPELESRGLQLSGTFLMKHFEDEQAWPDTEEELHKLGRTLVQSGAKFLILIDDIYSDYETGALTRPRRLDDDAWKRLIETTHRIARIAREQYKLQVVYHPHAETHVEYEDQIERLLADTDPAIISLCLDIGHHAYRGGDPITFMRKHHARIPYIHLKSVNADIQEKVEAEKIPFAKAVGMNMFCEPAKGAVNFEAFRDALHEIDFQGWAIVEQDMYPAPFDKPMPIAQRTRAYLREIGIG